MAVYHRIDVEGHRFLGDGPKLPEKVEVALGELFGVAKEGLLAFSVAIGFEVLRAMMEAEVTELVGPRGKHLSERWAWRHGTERGSVVLGGRKTAIRRPRVRTKDGREVRLKTPMPRYGASRRMKRHYPAYFQGRSF